MDFVVVRVEAVGDTLGYGYVYVYSFLVAVAGMIDPSAENDACTLGLLLQNGVQFIFSDDLYESLVRNGGESFQIVFGSLKLLVFLLFNNDVGIEMLGNANGHFLLANRIHSDVDSGVDVEVEKVGDVLDGHGEGLLPGWEVEFLF